MKSKYCFLSTAFVAASVLLGSAEASAGGGGGGWWGRGGVARVRDLHACVDSYTDQLRVTFRAPGAQGHGNRGGFVVAADLWGDALCVLPGLPPIPVPYPGPAYPGPAYPGPAYDSCGAFLPPPPPVLLPPPYLPPPGPITDVAYFDGFMTHEDLALRNPGNRYYANLDLDYLVDTVCGPGYLEDLQIDKLTIFIDGVPFFLPYNPPPCGADW